uniref:fatty acid desaturase family protein n=1 Tax=Lipingzhangella rawalii TaxID=2055835 RepID=UPI003898ED0F
MIREIRESGLLRARPGYYGLRATVLALLFGGGWTAFLIVGDSWWQLLVAAVLAVVFGQVGLFAHDLAHQQVFRRRTYSDLTGRLVGNLGIGMSYGWWQDKHTRHHANPNHEGSDPDIGTEIFVWSTDQARAATGITRVIGRWQAFLFYPLLLLEGMNLHVQSVRALFQPWMKRRALEGGLLLAHFVGYLGLVFLVLPPAMAVAFLVVHQGLFGVYLGIVFAPNHKGMPTVTPGQRLDFLSKQVLTTRNVRGNWFTDVALGGLNYQIEHHLLPNMPSVHLRAAQPIVRDHCVRIGLPYHETGFFGSHAEALRHLHQAGAPLRQRR